MVFPTSNRPPLSTLGSSFSTQGTESSRFLGELSGDARRACDPSGFAMTSLTTLDRQRTRRAARPMKKRRKRCAGDALQRVYAASINGID